MCVDKLPWSRPQRSILWTVTVEIHRTRRERRITDLGFPFVGFYLHFSHSGTHWDRRFQYVVKMGPQCFLVGSHPSRPCRQLPLLISSILLSEMETYSPHHSSVAFGTLLSITMRVETFYVRRCHQCIS